MNKYTAYTALTDDEINFRVMEADNGWEIDIPDYCNSWEETGPIIKKHFIGIQCEDMHENPNESSIWRADAPTGNHAHDENPLRAVCIVFLMMKGV